jgi:DNA (cytosine-5)-methyltransferase 1
MLNGLDLFSGIGGISLALAPWVRPIAYCENDRYAQSVLLCRMHEGLLPIAPIWDDVRTLTANHLPAIDLVYGGFPCQDISIAGAGAGLAGERSGLFFELVRLVGELRPRFVFLENVPAISFRGLDRVLLEFTALGYDSRWTTISAAELGAPHLRERWFLLCHSNSDSSGLQITGSEPHTEILHQRSPRSSSLDLVQRDVWKKSPSSVSRMDDGLPLKTHRIKALGNSVVPRQAREAFMRLAGLK